MSARIKTRNEKTFEQPSIFYTLEFGARCSSVVRAFAHDAMGRRIDPSWGGPIELFLVPKAVVCAILSVDGAYKIPLAANRKEGGNGFPLLLSEWSFTICPTPYNRK